MTGREDAQAFSVHISALVRPLVGLDLSHEERRALTAVACLDTSTALTIADLLQRFRAAQPLTIATRS